MNVMLDRNTVSFDKPMIVREILKTMHLSPETHLVTINGELVTPDITAKVGDEVRIVRVVSGG